MLDINLIKEKPDFVKENAKNKGVIVDVDEIIKLDAERKKLLQQVESLRATKNRATDKMGSLSKEERGALIAELQKVDQEADRAEADLASLEKQLRELLYAIPNMPLDDVPVGADESANVVVKTVGEKPTFNFKVKDHVALGELHNIIDFDHAAHVSGARFVYLKGGLVLLQFALMQFALSILTSEEKLRPIADHVEPGYSAKPFLPVLPPVMIKPDVFRSMGRLSDQDKDDKYYVESDDLYLIGSAEHTLGPLHMNETLREGDLPIRYVGYSTSFRREAGSYGKDTRGLIRMHQFDKLEMESFTTPEIGEKEHRFMVAIQEYLMQALKLPYQVVTLSTGDMGAPDAHQIDIETWLPGQNAYRETHSADYVTDFQSRRLNVRIKRIDGTRVYAHMNDATVFSQRPLIAILENYQQADGSIVVPDVLRPYVNFSVIK